MDIWPPAGRKGNAAWIQHDPIFHNCFGFHRVNKQQPLKNKWYFSDSLQCITTRTWGVTCLNASNLNNQIIRLSTLALTRLFHPLVFTWVLQVYTISPSKEAVERGPQGNWDSRVWDCASPSGSHSSKKDPQPKHGMWLSDVRLVSHNLNTFLRACEAWCKSRGAARKTCPRWIYRW